MKKAELKKNYNTGSCAWLGLDVRTYLAWAGLGLGWVTFRVPFSVYLCQ